MLKAASFFILRSPSLPTNFPRHRLEKHLRAPLNKDASGYQASDEIELFRAGLQIAAPRVLKLFDGLTLEGGLNGDFNKSLGVIYRYATRAAYRSTPFGAFSTVTMGHPDDKTSIYLADYASIKLTPSLSSDASSKIFNLYFDNILNKRLAEVILNPTLESFDKRYWFHTLDSGDARSVFHKNVLDASPVTDAILAICKQTKSPLAIEESLRSVLPGLSQGEANAIIEFSLRSGLLLYVHKLRSYSTNPFSELDICGNFVGHDGDGPNIELRPKIRDLRDELSYTRNFSPKDVDNLISSIQTKVSDILRQDEVSSADLRTNSIVNVIARRPAPESSLSEAYVQSTMSKLEEILRRVARPNPTYRNLVRKFHGRFGEDAVPLLKALDSEQGVPADEVYGNSGPHQDDNLDLTNFLREECTNFDLSLMRGNSYSINLRDFEPSRGASSILSRIYGGSIILNLRAQPEGRESLEGYIAQIYPGSGAELLSRFCPSWPDLENAVNGLVEEFDAVHSDRQAVEIDHVELSEHREVAYRPARILKNSIGAFSIDGSRAHADGAPEFNLKDLYICYRDDNLYLFDGVSGKELSIRMTSAHNWSHPKHSNLLRLLPLLGSKISCNFSWPSEFLSRAFLPRVHYNGLWLSPQAWRISERFKSKLLKTRGIAKAALFRSYASELGLPNEILLGHSDRMLPVRLDSDLSILSSCNSKMSRFVYEPFHVSGREIVRSERGAHNNEVIIPFVNQGYEAGSSRISTIGERVPKNQTRASPGGDWTYFLIFGSRREVELVVLKLLEHIGAELQRLNIVWFFVRYSEGGHHIRIRFKFSLLENVDLYSNIKTVLDQYARTGEIRRWHLGTYDQETFRYGGGESLSVVERIFNIDSEACISALSLLNSHVAGDRIEHQRAYALMFAHKIFEIFDLDSKSIIETLSHWVPGNAPPSISQVVREWFSEKSALGRATRGAWETGNCAVAELEEPLNILQKNAPQLRLCAERIRDLSLSGSLTNSVSGIIRAIIHMSCNRCNLGQYAEEELIVLHILKRFFVSREFAQRSRFLSA